MIIINMWDIRSLKITVISKDGVSSVVARINDSKTEFILIAGTRQQLCKLQPCAISVGHDMYNHFKNASQKPWLLAGLTS